MIAVVETWLKGEEIIDAEGFKWVGRNRRLLHKRAVRGSSGVGILIKEELLKRCNLEILDADSEDILWVKLDWKEDESSLVLAVCYIPPETSSRGKGSEETLQLLAEQVGKFGALGPIVTCGDFNARCGNLEVEVDGIPNRHITDVMKNSQGEGFVDFLRSTEMCVVNGQIGRDTFTCVSNRGCSVVDYCVIRVENFHLIENFEVTTMRESIDEMKLEGEAVRVPDHSLLRWEIRTEGVVSRIRTEKNRKEEKVKRRYIIP